MQPYSAGLPAAMSEHITVLRIGVNIERKSLVVDYTMGGGAIPSKRRRFMPMKGSSADEIVKALRSRHKKYLAALPEDKLRGLANWFLKKAKSAQPGDAPRTIVARPNTSRGTAASARSDDAAESRIHLAEIAAKNVDLNKVDDDQLMEVKAVMEKEFSLRATAKGTAEFQYDVKKKFSQTEESGWDSESDPVDE